MKTARRGTGQHMEDPEHLQKQLLLQLDLFNHLHKNTKTENFTTFTGFKSYLNVTAALEERKYFSFM